jgi:hypothetical protein
MNSTGSPRRRLQRQSSRPQPFVAEAAVAIASLRKQGNSQALPEESSKHVRSPRTPARQPAKPAPASRLAQSEIFPNEYQRKQREAAQARALQLAREWLLHQKSPQPGLEGVTALVGAPLAKVYYAGGLAQARKEMLAKELEDKVVQIAYNYMGHSTPPQPALKKFREVLGDELVNRSYARAVAYLLEQSGQSHAS